MSTHDIEINGTLLKRNGWLPKDWLTNFTKKEWKELEETYESEHLSFCDECGIAHEIDQYHNPSFVISDGGGFYCKSCIDPADLLTEIKEVDDFFKAKDVADMDLGDEYQEVDTLFCDSSGFGRSYEPALTKEQARMRVADWLKREKGPLYAGITGAGQFQVYVTLYKKHEKKKGKSK
jgi:hypothetical protein